MTTNKGEVRRLEGSRDWTSELSVHRADDRVVRLQQVETMFYNDGNDDYYFDVCGEDDDHEQDLAMC